MLSGVYCVSGCVVLACFVGSEDAVGRLLHLLGCELQLGTAEVHVAFALQGYELNVSVVHFESEHGHAYLSAGESCAQRFCHLFGEDYHVGEVVVVEVEEVVHLLLGHNQRVALCQRVDVEKGVELVVLGTVVGGDFAGYDA